jgi:hypothetical protein
MLAFNFFRYSTTLYSSFVVSLAGNFRPELSSGVSLSKGVEFGVILGDFVMVGWFFKMGSFLLVWTTKILGNYSSFVGTSKDDV